MNLIFPRFLLPLVALGCVLVAASQLDAQPDKEKSKVLKESFRALTIDGVRLVGDFYPPQPRRDAKLMLKGNNAPCVLLLHGRSGQSGTSGGRKDFGKFPEKLAEEGFAVLAFDFRGYGESVNVEKEYWLWRNIQANKTKIGTRDFRNLLDYLMMGNDIMEAKLFLNKMSDDRRCNSNNIIIIGADEGAVLGLLWAAHGFSGTAVKQIDPTRRNPTGVWSGPRERIDEKPEGEDISCVIWLSLQKAEIARAAVTVQVRTGLETLRDKGVGTLVLHGDTDSAAKGFWNYNFRLIKPDKTKDQFETTQLRTIAKAGKLSGTNLLNKPAFDTEKIILEYLAKPRVLKDQPWQKKSDRELQQSLFAVERFLR